MERFEEYLSEVGRRMAGRVDELKREELIAELRSHLALSLRAGEEELGMDRPEAVRSALRGLGAPQLVAEDLIRQVTGRSSKSAWRLARWPMGLDLLAYFAVPLFLTAMPYTYRNPSILSVDGWLGFMSLLAFWLAVRRSRRWLVGPMAAAIAGGFVLWFAIYFTPWYQRVQQAAMASAGAAPDVARRLKEIDRDLRLADAGAAGLTANPELYRKDEYGYMAPSWVQASSGYETPYVPLNISVPAGKVLTMESIRSIKEAKRAWEENGAAWRQNLIAEQASLVYPRAGPDLGIVAYIVAFPLARVGILAVVNWGVLSLAARRRRRVRDRFVRG